MQIVIPSGIPTMLNGWPGYLISGPSNISYRFYNPEYNSGYFSYVLSGSASFNLGDTSGSILGIGSNSVTLLPGEHTLNLTANSDYIIGTLELEGFNIYPIPTFPKSTVTVFEKELSTPNPIVRISSKGNTAVYLNGVCIKFFKGTLTLSEGPGYYKIVSEYNGTIDISEGFRSGIDER